MKPLGRKAYGSIPHLPDSRMGPADHHCHEGQARICTERTRDRHDVVIVQEKLDGSCVAAAKINGEIVALGRAGFRATTSPYAQHLVWDGWVSGQRRRFDAALEEGEWMCGEWLAQAHGTRYELRHDPFVAFDVFGRDGERLPFVRWMERCAAGSFVQPALLHIGREPIPSREAMRRLGPFGHHGALDAPEGVVYRVERSGAVDFLAKYVRPDKADGCFLPEIANADPIWNWSSTP